MIVPFLDLRRRVEAMRFGLDTGIDAVLSGGRFIGGPPVEDFERAFASYCGAGYCVGVASGTDAISLALQAAGLERGDEVITVANTCAPTIAGIERAGGVPVLVDAHPDTWTLDPAAIEDALSTRTRAIVPVHLYGRCAAMAPILQIAGQRGLKVIEDCAQAHGALYEGRRAGSLGDAAAFSFYPTKNLGALGDAGAVVTNDAGIAERVLLLRSYGERRPQCSNIRGYNSRLDTFQAAVLLFSLPRLDGWNERRRALGAFYRDKLSATDLRLSDPDDGHVYHLFVIRSSDRDALRQRLDERGIATLVHYPLAVHQHPAYRELARPHLEQSEGLAAEVVSLPLYPELTDAEAEAVVDAIIR